MSDESPTAKRPRLRLLRRLLIVAGVILAAAAIGDQVRLWSWKRAAMSDDPAVRSHAFARIEREREHRAANVVLAALETEQDRELLGEVAYAAYRISDRRAVPLLQRRADEGPDDPVTARMILYAARISDRDYRLIGWLSEGAISDAPWRRVASALGLLEIGQPSGGAMLIEMTPALPPEPKRLATTEFLRVAEPMAQTVGWPAHWPQQDPFPDDAQRWENLGEFWQRHGTARLLNDVLTRLDRRDWKWAQVNRLLRARDKIAKYL